MDPRSQAGYTAWGLAVSRVGALEGSRDKFGQKKRSKQTGERNKILKRKEVAAGPTCQNPNTQSALVSTLLPSYVTEACGQRPLPGPSPPLASPNRKETVPGWFKAPVCSLPWPSAPTVLPDTMEKGTAVPVFPGDWSVHHRPWPPICQSCARPGPCLQCTSTILESKTASTSKCPRLAGPQGGHCGLIGFPD